MSQERFLRCPHCNLPHEATATECPMTGKRIELQPRKRSAPPVALQPKWRTPLPDPSEMAGDEPSPSVTRMFGLVIDGKYRLDRLIGRGGMGVVYEAENLRLGRRVAVKVLLRGHEAGSAARKRFEREAKAAGTIGHPNVVQVFDVGVMPDGVPFMVMELLSGQSLAKMLSVRGALDPEKSRAIAMQVCAGLQAVHEAQVIHRDLKPDNVFLTTAGVKLVDFGVSKAFDETMSLTKTGMVVGTPYYLSPEQARGEKDVDHRVDLWAAGVVLYEMLTGTLPFQGANYNALIAKILTSRPPRPSTLRPKLSAAIDEVVMRALAFAPEDRYQSARAMRRALDAIANVSETGTSSAPPEVFADVDVDIDLDD